MSNEEIIALANRARESFDDCISCLKELKYKMNCDVSIVYDTDVFLPGYIIANFDSLKLKISKTDKF